MFTSLKKKIWYQQFKEDKRIWTHGFKKTSFPGLAGKGRNGIREEQGRVKKLTVRVAKQQNEKWRARDKNRLSVPAPKTLSREALCSNRTFTRKSIMEHFTMSTALSWPSYLPETSPLTALEFWVTFQIHKIPNKSNKEVSFINIVHSYLELKWQGYMQCYS